MAYNLRINPIAQEDLKSIKKHMEEENSDTAIEFIKELLYKLVILRQFPELGQNLMNKMRISTKYRYVADGSYLIFYFFENNTISIQRVLHGSRDYITLFNEERK